MTLGEGKRKVLMLLDEYSSGGELTEDEDINLKMNDLFDIAQKDVAQWQPIVRRGEVRLDGTGSMALPADVSRVLCIRRNGACTSKYEVVDGKVLFETGDVSTLTLDYIAVPQTITPETEDDHEFEVSAEAANCLPFFAAAQQLIPDLVVDYGALYSIYQQMKSQLPRSVFSAGARGVRQMLYGRG